MGCVTMVIEIDGPGLDGAEALGLKEAVTMDLEKYGRVAVSRVEVDGPEQECIEGMAARRSTAWAGSPPTLPPVGTDTQNGRDRRGGRIPMEGCVCCGWFRYAPGPDGQGRICWGTCRRTGRPVDKLSDRCGGWEARRQAHRGGYKNDGQHGK